MIAGIDFPSPFEKDLFKERRSGTCFTAGNPYDPESLLTGAEIAAGLGYADKRQWPSESTYRAAVGGHLTPAQIAEVAPRKRVLGVEDLEVTRAEFERWRGVCHGCISRGSIGFGPSHVGSKHCQSGSIASGGTIAHCTCDICF